MLGCNCGSGLQADKANGTASQHGDHTDDSGSELSDDELDDRDKVGISVIKLIWPAIQICWLVGHLEAEVDSHALTLAANALAVTSDRLKGQEKLSTGVSVMLLATISVCMPRLSCNGCRAVKQQFSTEFSACMAGTPMHSMVAGKLCTCFQQERILLDFKWSSKGCDPLA